MGTSGSTKGSGSNTSLVPTWLNEPAPGPLPGGADAPADGAAGGADEGGGEGNTPPAGPRPQIVPPPEAARFQGARRNFTTFAASGGSDRPALRRAVRDYVRSGTRGSANATSRMGTSRATASDALGVFRGFQRNGVAETLIRLNLSGLVGRPARDVFIALTDVICKDGGSIDEAIARDSWLETVSELERFGIDDLEVLTPDQVEAVLQTFIAHAIKGKLFQEIGVNGLKVADQKAIEAFEAQFKSYIERSVQDSFSSDLSQLSSLSDQQIRDIVDRTYRDAWELLETWGDQ
jgi:hypothetical protein